MGCGKIKISSQLEPAVGQGYILLTNSSGFPEYDSFQEQVDDRVNALLTAGTGIGKTYNDASDQLTLSLSHLGLENLTDPNADRILFWDDSAGTFEWLTIGDGVKLSGTTLSVDIDGLTSIETLNLDKENDYYLIWDNSTTGYKKVRATLEYREFDDGLSVDSDYYGDVIKGTAGSGGVTLGDVCFLDTSGKWRQANASFELSTSPMIGIALNAATETNAVTILVKGTVRMAAFPSFSGNVGSRVYIDTTAGDLTTTKPSTTGDFVRVIGYTLSPDILWFDPDHSYYEI